MMSVWHKNRNHAWSDISFLNIKFKHFITKQVVKCAPNNYLWACSYQNYLQKCNWGEELVNDVSVAIMLDRPPNYSYHGFISIQCNFWYLAHIFLVPKSFMFKMIKGIELNDVTDPILRHKNILEWKKSVTLTTWWYQ